MLKITVELLPFGFEENKKTLGIMHIWNDGTGTITSGNYGYKIFKKSGEKLIWKNGEIKNFQRKRFGVWYLLFSVLFHAINSKVSDPPKPNNENFDPKIQI